MSFSPMIRPHLPFKPRQPYSDRRRSGGGRGSGHRGSQMVFHTPLDSVHSALLFTGAKPTEESEGLTGHMLAYHSRLPPSSDEQQAVAAVVSKVLEVLEKVILYPANFILCQLEEVQAVGSFKKGTMLAGHGTADVVAVFRDLPATKAVVALGKLVEDHFTEANPLANDSEEAPTLLIQPYGFDLQYLGACVRVLVTTHTSKFKSCDPTVHVPVNHLSRAQAAIRNSHWFEENACQTNIKVLVRILKSFKKTFTGFECLTPWQIELLAYYCTLSNPSRKALPLHAAFRRVLQLLSVGFFLPGSVGFSDPCDTFQRRIHITIPRAKQDELCCAAQTMLRIIGIDLYDVVFCPHSSPELINPETLAEKASLLAGFVVQPSMPVYVETQESTDEVLPMDDVQPNNSGPDKME